MKIDIEKVKYIPKVLTPGILYVSKEYMTCAHLCACGCGEKVRTPLGPTEWKVTETANGPSLFPSVGNWQLDCRSHYWISDGKICWAEDWPEERVIAGRRYEEERRKIYYEALDAQKEGWLLKIWRRIRGYLKL